MQGLDWDNIRFFLQVVRQGSVSSAADTLAVNQTTVSRRIQALEDHFGKRLFERSSRKWSLTGMGAQLVPLAEKIAEDADAIERQLLVDSHALSGLLRIAVADACMQELLMPVLHNFTQKYPDIDLELIATSDELNLAARKVDIALHTTDTPPANVTGKRIGFLSYAIYGNKALQQKIKNNPQDRSIPCITWLGDGVSLPPWIEKNYPQARRIYRTSELGLMQRMASEGLGIAKMPCVFGDQNSNLYRIKTEYIERGEGLWVLSYVDLRTTARVRVFRDFLIDSLQQKIDLIEGIIN